MGSMAECARRVGADKPPAPIDGAHSRRRHSGNRLINTSISLHSIHRLLGLWIRVFRISGSRRRLDPNILQATASNWLAVCVRDAGWYRPSSGSGCGVST